MSKVHTQEQTKVISVTIELTPDEARKLRARLGDAPNTLAQQLGGYGLQGSLQQYCAPRDGLDDLRAQLKQALDGKN